METHCPHIAKKASNSYETMSLEETFAYVRAGGSLSRFGDGEVRALVGQRILKQKGSEELRKALKFVADLGGSPQSWPCLCVGTYPLLDRNFSRFRLGRRRSFAQQIYADYIEIWTKFMKPGKYCDSFVSRPDGLNPAEFPAIDFFTPHWQRVFEGRRVLLVRGSSGDNIPATADKSVFERHFAHAQSVAQLITFPGPDGKVSLANTSSNVFDLYVYLRDEILTHIRRRSADIVVLSLGPSATVLAAELSCRGYQAIDVGQFGGNFSKP